MFWQGDSVDKMTPLPYHKIAIQPVYGRGDPCGRPGTLHLALLKCIMKPIAVDKGKAHCEQGAITSSNSGACRADFADCCFHPCSAATNIKSFSSNTDSFTCPGVNRTRQFHHKTYQTGSGSSDTFLKMDGYGMGSTSSEPTLARSVGFQYWHGWKR